MSTRIAIADASTPALSAFATTMLQLEKVPTDRSEIIAAIRTAGWTQDTIIAAEEAPALSTQTEAPNPPAKNVGILAKYDDPLVELIIGGTERPGGNEPACPTVNGSDCLIIQRGVKVKIPYRFYEALNNAGGTAVVPAADGINTVEMHYTNYPLTHVVLPPQAEIDAWIARSGEVELGAHRKAA